MGTWATNDPNIPGYDLMARVNNWKKRGLLSAFGLEVFLHALRDGQDMHAILDVRGRPTITMNGEPYTVQEWERMIGNMRMADGERMDN